MKKKYTNSEIYELIRQGGKEQNTAIKWIYSRSGWTAIAKNVLFNMGASKVQSQDIIQEGIVALLMDVTANKIKNADGVKSYFVQSCRNIWLNQTKREKRGKELAEENWTESDEAEDDSEKMYAQEFWVELDNILEKLGRKCKDILKYWAMGYNHQEIASKIGYENANVSKKTKSVCIEKLKALGLKKSDWINK